MTNKICGFVLGALVAGVALVGCETGGSADSTIRQVSANFTGVYENDGQPLASSQSGAEITVLSLRQTGDRLEAFDNRDLVWKGTIGEVFVTDEGGGARAPFTLEGRTTAGAKVTISGTLFAENNSDSAGANAVMTGTWIEDTLFATFYAEGTVASIVVPDNNGGGTNTTDVAISPSSATLTINGETRQFSASGGDGSYTWQLSNNNGAISPTTGSTVTYTRNAAGNNTITVRDGSGNSQSVTISQP
jgi:hypothetical protein